MVRFFRGINLLGQAIVQPDVPLAELDEEMGEEQARLGCIGCPSGDVDIDVRPPL